MQTLWTRALQVKSTCKCPSCANPQRALARRVNTAPPTRRLLRPGDLFTACFSTTVFIGAAADARYKQYRREEIDGVILLAKEDLRALDEDQARRLKALGVDTTQIAGPPPPKVASVASADTASNSDRLRGAAQWPSREGRAQPRPEVPSKRKAGRRTSLGSIDGPSLKTFVSDPHRLGVYRPAVNLEPQQDIDAPPTTLPTPQSRQDESLPPGAHRDNLNRASRQTIESSERCELDVRKRKSKRKGHGTRFYAEINSAVPSQDTLSKILLDSRPIDPHVGRSSEEAWGSKSTPSLNTRLILQAQNAMAVLVYRIILSRLHHTEHFEVSFAGGHRQRFTQADTDSITATIRELSQTRRGVITSAKKAPEISQQIEPLSFPPYELVARSQRGEELNGTAMQEEELLSLLSQPLQVDELLSQLCSTLACQKFTPNIHIFNILLIKLTELHLPSVTKYVIDAMEQTHVIQNEITHTAVLNAHADADNSSKFLNHLDDMDGLRGRGCLPAKGPQTIAKRSPHSLIFGHEPHVHAIAEFKLPEPKVTNFKVPRTQDMYEAIIGGLLRFSQVERALAEYARMIRSGFLPTHDMYQSFLRYCVKVKAWKIGWNIWTQLCNDSHVLDSVLYYWMLQLCASCGRTKEFETIKRSAEDNGIVPVPLNIAHFQWTEGEFEQTFKYSSAIQRLQRHTPIPGYDTGPPQQAVFDARWPANLFTLVQEQFSTLVSWKKSIVGYCVGERGQDLVVQFQKRSKRPGQWLTINARSGKVEFVHSGKWTERDVFDYRNAPPRLTYRKRSTALP